MCLQLLSVYRRRIPTCFLQRLHSILEWIPQNSELFPDFLQRLPVQVIPLHLVIETFV